MFLVFEGIDGSGKGTVIEKVEVHLKNEGVDFISVRDPGSTSIGHGIREILLNPEYDKMSREAELLLYLAARAQLVKEVIEPALKEGKTVVCDRYDLSTYTYQYVMGGWDSMNGIMGVSGILDGLPKPDWYFILDLSVETARERLGSSLDRLEQKGIDTFNKIRNRYLKYAAEWDNTSVIDASKTPEEVTKATISEVDRVRLSGNYTLSS